MKTPVQGFFLFFLLLFKALAGKQLGIGWEQDKVQDIDSPHTKF